MRLPALLLFALLGLAMLAACGGADEQKSKQQTAKKKQASSFDALKSMSESKPEPAGKSEASKEVPEYQPEEAKEPEILDEVKSWEKAPFYPIAKPEETITFEGGLSVFLNKGAERLEAKGELLGGQRRPLEFLIVSQGGALHEALIWIGCKASHFKNGLELLELEEGKEKLARRGQDMMPQGDKVTIEVRWTDAEGVERQAPIEDWVHNRRTKKRMTRGPWIFTGAQSRLREDTGRMTFEPDFTGNIVATWRDPGCVIDNPRPHGLDPTCYLVNPYAPMPEMNTPVTLIIRAAN